MPSNGRWSVAIVISLAVAGSGCSPAPPGAAAQEPHDAPAVIGKADRNGVKSVKLTRQAFDRLGIETVMIGQVPATTTSGTHTGRSSAQTVVPYSAVLYAPDGGTWVYTVPRHLTFVRQKVVVATVGAAGGTEAVLSQGPPAGTTVVSTGVVELYGAELGVGE